MSLIEDNKHDFLVQIARMYYIDKMSQQEIAETVHMSRSNVSRMLNNCIANGVIEIKINDVFTKDNETAAKIKSYFDLKEVYICASENDSDRSRENVAALAALYLKKNLQKGMQLGVTWGRTNYCVAKNLSSSKHIGVDVIQLLGGTDYRVVNSDGQRLVEAFSKSLFGKAYILQAPLLVRTKLLRDLILQENIIRKTFQKFEAIDIALIGVGQVSHNDFNSMVLTKADMLQLIELEAVSCFAGRFFDINGFPCNAGINERIIGIDMDVLKRVPIVVAAVSGEEKLKATLGMLRSGLLNVLILDELLARSLLRTLPSRIR